MSLAKDQRHARHFAKFPRAPPRKSKLHWFSRVTFIAIILDACLLGDVCPSFSISFSRAGHACGDSDFPPDSARSHNLLLGPPSKTFFPGKEHVHLLPLLLIIAHPLSSAALSCATLIGLSIASFKSLDLEHLKSSTRLC